MLLESSNKCSIGECQVDRQTWNSDVRAISWQCGQQQITAHCKFRSHPKDCRSASASCQRVNDNKISLVKYLGYPFRTERACPTPSTVSRLPSRAWEVAGRSPSNLLDPSTRCVSPSPVHDHERREQGRLEVCPQPVAQTAVTMIPM